MHSADSVEYYNRLAMSSAILGSAIFLVLAPGTVAGWMPRWIRSRSNAAVWLEVDAVRVVGALLFTAGLLILLDCFARFAIQGLGTPAPVAPTKTLVVTGLYRYVRNPMYVAVLALILGQGLLWANLQVMGYGCAVWVVFHFWVMAYEEPTLADTFASQYADFRLNVPRWIPRLTPWIGNVSH